MDLPRQAVEVELAPQAKDVKGKYWQDIEVDIIENNRKMIDQKNCTVTLLIQHWSRRDCTLVIPLYYFSLEYTLNCANQNQNWILDPGPVFNRTRVRVPKRQIRLWSEHPDLDKRRRWQFFQVGSGSMSFFIFQDACIFFFFEYYCEISIFLYRSVKLINRFH